MSASKTNLTAPAIGFACLFVAACAPSRIPFSDGDTRNMYLYSHALKDDTNGKIIIYKTGFSEKLIESGSIIGHASLNDETMRETVPYRPQRKGYRQELYLVQVNAARRSETWFYFSVWYRQNKKTKQEEPYGFGKAYVGTADTARRTIYFARTLVPKKNKGRYYFDPKKTAQFYFVHDSLPADTLRINKIVIEEENKFAGPRPFVFVVAKHFPGDLNTLNFHKDSIHSFK